MSTPIPAPTPPSDARREGAFRRRSVPRWGWVLLTVAAAVVIVALVVAVLGSRGSGTTATAPAGVQPPVSGGPVPAAPIPTGTPGTGGGLVDGCLGGHGPDLDAVVLAAQHQAPLTPEGAASFAATFARWVLQIPSPPHFADTATQIFAPDASPSVRKPLSRAEETARVGFSLAADTTSGSFHVESFTGTGSSSVAVVTFQVRWTGTQNGEAGDPAVATSTLRLTAPGGTWHLQDSTQGRSEADMAQVGTAYAGGC